ncbi:uncharacterized protein LOC111342655, partial [Stylophora pistillata]|uniref:uncharacterized protein LOC111342655 n=1 Tax=Stylophora pistillata TaxID=50429 RepID=UPI000C03AAF6
MKSYVNHRVQPAASEIKTESNLKPPSKGRSTSDLHSVSFIVKPKQDKEDRSPSKVRTVSHAVRKASTFRSKNRTSPEAQRTFSTSTKSVDLVSRTQPERHRSLLIYGADRLGTTFTTKMFAEDSQLMTVYEPLWITKKWNKEDISQIPNWTKNVLDLLRGILSWEPRTPNGLISSFLPKLFLENPDTDIRVIQLIRDPRASLRSRIKLKWMVDWKHSSFPNVVRKICSNLATNIKFGRNLGKWQDKYLEVHYHDLAGKPLETTRAMYEFAEFIMPDSVADWVVRNTSPTKEELMKE